MTKININKNKLITPKVSIGLPVFNGEATIRNVLESLRNQTFSNFEIIISLFLNCSCSHARTNVLWRIGYENKCV